SLSDPGNAFVSDSAGPDALYVIFIGQNDVRDAVAALAADPSGATGQAILQQAVIAIADNLGSLAAAGARPPVALPHGVTVTALRCGGKAPSDIKIIFTLRRNQPQVANVDMATVMTTFEGRGFRHPETTSITSAMVNNANFNYYIVASVRHIDVGLCPSCVIGYCRIRYTIE
nr:hypothetical protein [Gammaproteobacteria bacterium]